MLKYLCLGLSLILNLHAESLALTAITYNIRYDAGSDKEERDWDKRKDKVTGYLMEKDASIIGLQEVLHRQLKDVARALPGYMYVGVGRSDGKIRGEYSPLFYNVKVWKLDPQEHGTFWLSDTPEAPGSTSWGNSITRICSWARLVHIKSGQAIYVFNTHWDHRSQNSREKAADLILKKIRNRTHSVEPFIVMGDFNATTGNKAIKILLTSGILTNPGKHQFRTFNHWKAPLVKGPHIDHILVSKHWKNSSVVVESNSDSKGNAASDHHPVVLTTKLPAR